MALSNEAFELRRLLDSRFAEQSNLQARLSMDITARSVRSRDAESRSMASSTLQDMAPRSSEGTTAVRDEISRPEQHNASIPFQQPATGYSPLLQQSEGKASHTQFSESEEKRFAPNQALTYIPWTLRRPVLVVLTTVLVMLIVALEILSHFSRKNQGLATSTQSIHYAWTYGPTAVFSILAVIWSNLEVHTRALMPWNIISTKKQPLERALDLDYISANLPMAMWTSIKFRHLPVFTAAMGSVAIIFVTVVSTGLLVLQPTVIERDTAMSSVRRFSDMTFNSSAVDSFPILTVSSIMSENFSSVIYPPNTNADYAVEPFEIPRPIKGSEISRSAIVQAFSANLDCSIGSLVSHSVYNSTPDSLVMDEWAITVNVSDGDCSTGRFVLARPTLDSESPAREYALNGGALVLRKCPSSGSPKGSIEAFLVFAQVNATTKFTKRGLNITHYDIESAVLRCRPSYTTNNALVTLDSLGAITDVVPQNNPREISANDWDILTAFNNSLTISASLMLETDMSLGGHLYDSFFSALTMTWFKQPPRRYLNHKNLAEDSQRFFKAACAQIVNRFLSDDSPGVSSDIAPATELKGTYQATELRIVIRDPPLRMLEAGLVIIVICAVIMFFARPLVPSLTGDVVLGLVAVVAAQRTCTGRREHGNVESQEPRSSSDTRRSFDQPSSHEETAFQSWATKPHLLAKTSSTTTSEPDRKPKWWQPMAFGWPFKILALIIPVAVIITLEVTYQSSEKHDGLGDVEAGRYWHYLYTMIPALVMTSVKLLHQSVAFSVALLDPFRLLSKAGATASNTLFDDNRSKTSLQLFFKGIRTKQWALSSIAVSALLGPFLTIVISGLFESRPTQRMQQVNVTLVDHLRDPSTRFCGRSTTLEQASISAANLLIQGYGGYPAGTYGSFVYPGFDHVIDEALLWDNQTRLTNASNLVVNSPVLRPNTVCEVLDQAGLRYSLASDGSNHPFGQKSIPESYWLNYTHTALAGCTCPPDERYCKDYIISQFISLKKNSSVFASTDFIEQTRKYETFSPVSAYHDLTASALDRSLPCPDNLMTYGTWKPMDADLTIIACYKGVEQVDANITYDFSQNLVTDVQAVDRAETLNVTRECYPGLANALQVQSFLPYVMDGPYDSMWMAALNNTSPDQLLNKANATVFASRLERIYNTFVAQYYNGILRSTNFSVASHQTSGVRTQDDWPRLFQTKTSTRVLEALLAAMCLFTLISLFLSREKELLLENPCSIAAQLRLFDQAAFLERISDDAVHCSHRELMNNPPFRDGDFGLGWWDGVSGRWYGIDVGVPDRNIDIRSGEK